VQFAFRIAELRRVVNQGVEAYGEIALTVTIASSDDALSKLMTQKSTFHVM
jgi:hypothetical protein